MLHRSSPVLGEIRTRQVQIPFGYNMPIADIERMDINVIKDA